MREYNMKKISLARIPSSARIIENIRISWQSIVTNRLRTILTIMIIAIGIMALVGILTAIDSIERSVNSSFSAMGANTFNIRSRGYTVQVGNNRQRVRNFAKISYREAEAFKNAFQFPAVVSISIGATRNATVKFNSYKSDPNVTVSGVDENYLVTGGYQINQGRNFTEQDIHSGKALVIIGSELAANVFSDGQNPLNQSIQIANGNYRIIGVLSEKGASLIGSSDRVCFLPVTHIRQYFSYPSMSFQISVMPAEGYDLGECMGEAEGLFRVIRGLSAKDPSDFNTIRSDNIAQLLMESIGSVTMAATLIGLITLLGAAIGLMNIMLVGVAERTREIGVRKAIGANNRTIKQQFLTEAVLISQIGGFVGILLGFAVGNVVPMLTGGVFIIPWIWMLVGLILCLAVGVLSGLYPAMKAAEVSPIESLRYE